MAFALPPASDIASLICIYRPEQMGSLNILPTEVQIAPSQAIVAGPPRVTMTGGSNFCLWLPIGPADILVSFPQPYGDSLKPVYWTSRFPANLEKGETSYILDVPADLDTNAPDWIDTGWHGMWNVRLVKPGDALP
jgi:hypothetical protein